MKITIKNDRVNKNKENEPVRQKLITLSDALGHRRITRRVEERGRKIRVLHDEGCNVKRVEHYDPSFYLNRTKLINGRNR